MTENTKNKNYILIFIMIIIFLIFIVLYLAFKYKTYKFNSLNNGNTSINYYYEYFKKNEESFKKLSNYLIENKIIEINKNEENLSCGDKQITNKKNIYFCSENDIKVDNSIVDFLNNSIIKEIYITNDNNYYIFIIYSSSIKGIVYEYCIEDCQLEDRIEAERRGENLRYMIDIKIDDNWKFSYNEDL